MSSPDTYLRIASLLILTAVSLGSSVAFAQGTIDASLVQTTDTSEWSSPSSDPAGLAYRPDANRLVISDSEVNEIDRLFGGNVFEVDVSGSLLDVASTTDFSREPTGVALSPDNGHIFFSDDRDRRIYEVNPGRDRWLGTEDDTVTFFDTRAFNSTDPEGIAFDSLRGHLFVVDGSGKEVYDIAPGPNGYFDGVEATGGDDLVTSFDVEHLRVKDPEGIEYNPATGTLFIVESSSKGKVFETTTDGTLLRVIDISEANAEVPAGLTFAPGSRNPSVLHLYIVDRVHDNINDGKLYEMSLPPNPIPTISSFTPMAELPGTQVTLTGYNFSDTTQVNINGTAAGFTVISDNEILATVPVRASNGRISVTSGKGTGFTPGKFTVLIKPYITLFSPNAGSEGTMTTLVGAGFSGVTSVTFNGLLSTNVVLDSDNQVRAEVPPGATSGRIAISNRAGISESPDTFAVLPAITFTLTDDAYVDSSRSSSNFGDSNQIRLRNGQTVINTYLKFEITGLQTPVLSAKLRLFATDENNSGGTLFSVSNNWDEGRINWNNAPSLSSRPLDFAGPTLTHTKAEFDVTAEIAGNGMYSFGLSSSSPHSVSYSSREGSRPPELVVTPAPLHTIVSSQ